MIASLSCSSVQSQRRPASLPEIAQIELSSNEVTRGSVFKIQATLTSLPRYGKPEVTARFDHQVIAMTPSRYNARVFEAWIGIPLERAPGASFVLIAAGTGGDAQWSRIPLTITQGTLSAANPQVRIEPQVSELTSIYRDSRPGRLWSKGFVLPIEIKNSVLKPAPKPSAGSPELLTIELRAASAAKVHAASRGVIVFARELANSGNTIVIDHGEGIFTYYAHLSEIIFPEGTHVETGEVIGIMGTSGRSTLHWAAVVNEVPVSPLNLVEHVRE